MGETLPIFSTTFNGSVQVEARADHLSADSGALLLREIMERTGIVEWMDERLLDPRNPLLITYPLAELLRTSLLLLGQGLARPGRRRPAAARPELARGQRHPPGHVRAGARKRAALAADAVAVGGSVERADQPGGGA